MRKSMILLVCFSVLAGAMPPAFGLSEKFENQLNNDPVLHRLWAEMHKPSTISQASHIEAEKERLLRGTIPRPSSLNMSLTSPEDADYRAIPSVRMDTEFSARINASLTFGCTSTTLEDPGRITDEGLFETLLAALNNYRKYPEILRSLEKRLRLASASSPELEWLEHQIPYTKRQWRSCYEELKQLCGAEALGRDGITSPDDTIEPNSDS